MINASLVDNENPVSILSFSYSILKRDAKGQILQPTPIIQAFESQNQANLCEFQDGQDYILRPCLFFEINRLTTKMCLAQDPFDNSCHLGRPLFSKAACFPERLQPDFQITFIELHIV